MNSVSNSSENKMDNGLTNQLDPSVTDKYSIQLYLKLIYEMICFLIIIIPCIIQSIIVNLFFSRSKSVKDKVILVTGSGRGLGRRLAEKFIELGSRVACVDIDDALIRKTVKQINEKYPDSAKSYTCNVAKMDDVVKLRDAVKKDFGHVDILINNAGVVLNSRICDQDEDFINAVIGINLTSHFYMIHQFLPDMIERNEGHIVATSSAAALAPSVSYSVYSAAKGGVANLMNSLRLELQENPNNSIQTTTICPWLINSNAFYSGLWKSRLPLLSVEEAAEQCVNGIRKNKRIFTIPSFQYSIFLLLQLLPDSVDYWFRRIFYFKVAVPPKQMLKNIPVYAIMSKKN